MRHTIFLFLLLPAFLWGQYPNNARKQRLGYQTTGAGLVYIKSGAPSHTPADDEDAWMVLDTTNNALYYYDEAAGAWENILDDVVRDTVFRITSVPDTSTIVPLQGDLFINATADTLGAYAGPDGWQLFSGGTPLPDSLVYQSELETTIDTLLSGSGTAGYVPVWADVRELADSPISVSGGVVTVDGDFEVVLSSYTGFSIKNPGLQEVVGLSRISAADYLKAVNINLTSGANTIIASGVIGDKISHSTNYWEIAEDAKQQLRVLSTEVAINDNQRTGVDFRVESGYGTHFFFADASTEYIGINQNTPGYTLDIGGSSAAIRLNPTTAPTNAEGVIYANDSDDRLRYMDGVSNNILAYKSELSAFAGYADTVAVLKETTSQSLAATASYLRITGLETTGLAEVITTTDSTLTVPVDGNYRIRYNFSIQIAAAGAGTWRVNMLAYNNAANIPETQGSIQVVTAGTETWIQPVSGETITALTAGDEISLRYTATSGPTYTLYPGTITIEKL